MVDEGAPLTILFTDVEGSTDLRTRRGDAAAHEMLRDHEELVRACVADYGGREVKALGDGFMVVFASVRRALGCAVAIQQAVEAHHWRAAGGAVRVRVGVNTGEVMEEGDDLYGQAVNAAARIAARAQAGEILVSEVTRQLAGSGPDFSFGERGRLRLKGFPDRWRLFRLMWEPKGARPARTGEEHTPFVGRQAETAELQRLLDRAVGGSGGLVMVGGEPGVGKTRLTEELVAEARRRDVQVFVGHSYEMEGAPPYVAFVEIFESALAQAPNPQAFREALGEAAPEVARLIPNLRRLCPGIPPPLELPAEQERRLLFNSVRDVVARTARRRPLLVVLDDLHWSDDPTLFLVEHLAEAIAGLPVLMVATYRDTEVDVGRPLAKTFEDLRRRRLAHWISVSRMERREVGAMLQAMSGHVPPSLLVDALYAETDGNPFFVEEVYRYLVGEGRLLDAEGKFRADVVIGELDVPASVRLVVARRLQRLGPATPGLLATAAVVGRAFSVEILEAMEGTESDALLDAVEDAERARLIVAAPDPTGEDRFVFSHELIRQALLADLSLTRRRRLHTRAADALERHHADSLDRQAAAIAYHLREAGAPAERIFGYLLRAGRWAMAASAFEDALDHLERAATLRHAVGPAERAALLVDLALARRSTGHWDTAIDAWRQAVDAHAQIGDVDALGRLCVDAAMSLAFGFRHIEAAEMCQRGLGALGDRVSADRARLLDTMGVILSYAGDYRAGTSMIDQALAIAAELGDDGARGHALLSKCLHRWAWLELEEAIAAGHEAAALLEGSGDVFQAATALAFVALALIHVARLDEARQVTHELEPLAERLGNYVALLMLRRANAMKDFCESGDLDRLERFGQADLEDCQRQGLPWASQSVGWQGVAAFLRGDWDGARTRFEEGKLLALPGTINGWDIGPLLECLAYLGERSDALAVLETAEADVPEPGQPMGWGAWTVLISAVEGLTVLGEREWAARFYQHVVAGISRTKSVSGSFYDGRLLQRVAGIAAMAGTRWAESEAHFLQALDQAATIPHRVEEAHTRRWYGRMLLERGRPGDREEAAKVLAAAIGDYERMGMPRHRDMSAALLRG